jgi:hypothetical protein
MRFKKGDKVTVVRDCDGFVNAEYMFKTGTITDRSPTPYNWKVVFENGEYDFFDNELEHEQVYNSPLMKALK